ncbi:MAG: hypothetical protein ABI882_02640 [Acidobacteriota bacterium]
MTALLKDRTQLFKEFPGSESVRRWMTGMLSARTYRPLGTDAIGIVTVHAYLS